MNGLKISLCHRAPVSKASLYTDSQGRSRQLYTCDACLKYCRVTVEPAWGSVLLAKIKSLEEEPM